MKNVIIYNQINTTYHGGKRYTDENLINYLKCQVEWSLKLGWKKEDIIIGTNFDFEHMGVKNYHLKNICEYSGFNNFWYGALELMDRGVLDDDFWLHDQDSWQNTKFDFPKFDGEVAGCEYIGTRQWNCGSIYFKKTCKPILQYIVDLMKDNPDVPVSSDEEWIAFCRFREESQIKNYLSSINTAYNCGVTHHEKRYEQATKPVHVFSFKPDKKSDFDVVKDKVNKDIINIFKKHKLLGEGMSNKTAFLVFGTESSSTRFITDCLIKGGCEGQSEHDQLIDYEDPTAEKVVWRRSFPHKWDDPDNFPYIIKGTIGWPDTDAMYDRLKNLGYEVKVVVCMRDWFACSKSAVDIGYRPHTNTMEKAYGNSKESYKRIFSFINDKDLDYTVISYESLVFYKEKYLNEIFKTLDLNEVSDIGVRNGNDKYYLQEN